VAEEVLLIEKSDGVATLTMNRPKSMNALSTGLRRALADAFTELQEDPQTQVVILTGAGERAFSAGLDLKELGGEAGPAADVGEAVGSVKDPVRVMDAFDRPIIGAINGVAITGGFELALACDILVGSSQARFADTHARVGILPGWGLSQKLPRMIGPVRAKALALTGNFLSAEEAERYGLLLRVVEPDALLPTCRALAADIQSCVPEAVRGYKRLLDDGYAVAYGESRELERKRSNEHAASVSSDQIAERRAGIQARGRTQS